MKKVTYAHDTAGSGGGTGTLQLRQNNVAVAATVANLTSGIRFMTSYPNIKVFEGDYFNAECTATNVVPASGLGVTMEFSPY